ncbi:hypothetical protein K438DRAFT_1873225, partial [Mycena galopus ATCC 62051]
KCAYLSYGGAHRLSVSSLAYLLVSVAPSRWTQGSVCPRRQPPSLSSLIVLLGRFFQFHSARLHCWPFRPALYCSVHSTVNPPVTRVAYDLTRAPGFTPTGAN